MSNNSKCKDVGGSASTFKAPVDKPHFPTLEEETLAYWTKENMFKKKYQESVDQNWPKYTFYDGPPFATGLPHYGHILAGAVKDVRCRFASQQGFQVQRRFGWDCHGLPIEFEIDKEHNIKTRDQVINEVGIAKYNELCRGIVQRYSKEWETQVTRIGRWIDFDNDYKTMDLSFMESCWWVFNEIFNKGLVYKAFKVMPYSMPIATPLSNFEAQNYRDVSDPSIVVTFPCTSSSRNDLVFLAWTTTPWTLPSNLALCVHPTMKYCEFQIKDEANKGKTFIVSENRRTWLFKELKLKDLVTKKEKDAQGEEVEIRECGESENVKFIKRNVEGKEYVGLHYQPLFSDIATHEFWAKTSYKVVSDEYVTEDGGTGVVHQAPAFGEDDYRVCMANGVITKGGELLCPLDVNCNYTDEAPEFVQGLNVKAADEKIKRRLKEEGRIVVNQTIVHAYPFCWRSDTPLIYRAVPCWFINVEAVKDQVVENNKQVHWVPHSVGHGRFHNWLVNARDWCVSRNRFWGTPIPIWTSEDGKEVKCIGSVAELQQYTDKPITDIHRHLLDDIVMPDPRGAEYPPMKRVDEVFDCWFESGCMPYAQVHYPFENKQLFEDETFPADFIGEGLDQTRGWFYTLMVLSTALFNKPAFKNCVVNGLVLASDGKKMSKRLKNYPDPQIVVDKYGADALRLYLTSSPVVAGETLKFCEDGVQEKLKNTILPLFHAYRFMVQEASRWEHSTGKLFKYDKSIVENTPNFLDKWVIAELQKLTREYIKDMEGYVLQYTSTKITNFLESLTNTYVRFNRDRMKGGNGLEDAHINLQVTFYVLINLCSVMAATTPFIAEYVYQQLKVALPPAEQKDTIHEVLLKDVEAKAEDEHIISACRALQSAVIIGRTMREKRKVPLKTPIKHITLCHPKPELVDNLKSLKQYVEDEMNIMEVEITADQSNVDLKGEMNFRELGRQLGKDLPKVKAAVGTLTKVQLETFKEQGSIVIEGHTITSQQMTVRAVAKGTQSKTVDSDSCHISGVVVIADFESSDELIALSIARECANRLQKMRKALGLKVEDNTVKMFAKGGDETVAKVLVEKKDIIEKHIRREFFVEGVAGKPSNTLLGEEEYELNNGTLKLSFYA